MPCSQPEDGDLLGYVQLLDMVFLRSHLQTLPPCGLELASQDGFGFSVRHGVHSLFQVPVQQMCCCHAAGLAGAQI